MVLALRPSEPRSSSPSALIVVIDLKVDAFRSHRNEPIGARLEIGHGSPYRIDARANHHPEKDREIACPASHLQCHGIGWPQR
jgi:hypothetical protein